MDIVEITELLARVMSDTENLISLLRDEQFDTSNLAPPVSCTTLAQWFIRECNSQDRRSVIRVFARLAKRYREAVCFAAIHDALAADDDNTEFDVIVKSLIVPTSLQSQVNATIETLDHALRLAAELLRNSEAVWETLRLMDYWHEFHHASLNLSHVLSAKKLPTSILSVHLHAMCYALEQLLVFLNTLNRGYPQEVLWASTISKERVDERLMNRFREILTHRGQVDAADTMGLTHALEYVWPKLNQAYQPQSAAIVRDADFRRALLVILGFHKQLNVRLPGVADRRLAGARDAIHAITPVLGPTDLARRAFDDDIIPALTQALEQLPHYRDPSHPNRTPTIWPRSTGAA